jgi:hypothetical protein
LLLLAASVAASAALLPSQAGAITRQQADQIALKALNPQAEIGPAVVFGLPKALKPKDIVTELGTAAALKKAGAAAWLYWEDFDPGAMFQHPSRVLVVDDKTGKVKKNANLGFYPLVNGKAPAYLQSDTSYYASTYQIFSNLATPAARPLPRDPREPAPVAAVEPPSPAKIAPGAMDGDCLLMVTMTPQTGFELSNEKAAMKAWNDLASTLGIPSYVATNTGPVSTTGLTNPLPPPFPRQVDDKSIAGVIETLVDSKNCKDVLVYIFGHGTPPPGWTNPAGKTVKGGPASILMGAQAPKGKPPVKKALTSTGIGKAVEVHAGKAKFKFVIESCFAERFDELTNAPNVLLVAGSSAPDQTSKMNASKHPGYAAVKPEVPNPDQPEFTHGMTEGAKEAIASGDTFPSLPALLREAFVNEKKNDRAALINAPALQTVPSIEDRLASCTGSFAPFDPQEARFAVKCERYSESLPGHRPLFASQATSFDLQLPGGRAVTKWLEPTGFTCKAKTRDSTNDTLSCTGALVAGAEADGNVRMSPGPTTGMGGLLFVTLDGIEQGPFAVTGP